MLVTLDTTRADRLSCYGYDTETSPAIDLLASEGVLFTQALSQAAVTPVSHASILTGRWPYEHGLRVMHGRSENRLPDEAITLAEVLRSDGYATGAFVSAFPVTAEFGFEQGFDAFDAGFLPDDLSDLVSAGGAVNTGSVQRRAGPTVDLALEWWRGTNGPRFLWLHLFDPHDARLPAPDRFIAPYRPLPDTEAEWLLAMYDIEIAYMDAELGRLFEELRNGPGWERTVVALTSDHGEGLGDHDWWTHGVLYQEQIRVPLILHAPGFEAGRRVDAMVRTIDLMPTVLELVALPQRSWPPMDGVSLVPLGTASGSAPTGFTDFAYSDSVNRMTYHMTKTIKDEKDDLLFALVDGRWKYVHHLLEEEESELYDLMEDPGELVNLYAERPEVVERLKDELMARDFLPVRQLEETDVSEDRIRALEALGYSGD